jgi:methyl-accepting chemotaxis protein
MFAILGFVTLLLIVMALTVDYQTRRLGELKDSQILASQLAADMLELRRNEKDFMLRREIKYLDKFEDHYEAMQATLSRSALPEENAS